MKDFFKSLTFPITLTVKFSMFMGFIALLLASQFDSMELMGVAFFLFVISTGKDDDDFNKFAS